ncbi:MAG: hypothetical protein NT069_18845 [Planctomycetota bacterium]|nr:hypothetical protein [Planctomycetota bacterium]
MFFRSLVELVQSRWFTSNRESANVRQRRTPNLQLTLLERRRVLNADVQFDPGQHSLVLSGFSGGAGAAIVVKDSTLPLGVDAVRFEISAAGDAFNDLSLSGLGATDAVLSEGGRILDVDKSLFSFDFSSLKLVGVPSGFGVSFDGAKLSDIQQVSVVSAGQVTVKDSSFGSALEVTALEIDFKGTVSGTGSLAVAADAAVTAIHVGGADDSPADAVLDISKGDLAVIDGRFSQLKIGGDLNALPLTLEGGKFNIGLALNSQI